jgi:hypothetical protein
MGITLTQTSTQPVLPVWLPSTDRDSVVDRGPATNRVSAMNCAHAMPGGPAAGGFSHSERSRTTDYLVRLQPSTDAVIGTSVSVAQGSQKPVFAPAGTLASGVPPRSRPV